jgi:DNA-binding response OmpR family regulator
MTSGAAPDRDGIPPGLRILVVDDEMMLAMMLEEMLNDFGCSVIKAARIAKAVPLAVTQPIDGAILDVNVAGEPIYPVAQELRRRGIPFAFVTGYGAGGVHADYHAYPMLSKPFRQEDLRRVVAAFAAHGSNREQEPSRSS